MGGPRGTTNRNVRGSSKGRAARRHYLVTVFQHEDLVGITRCHYCPTLLDFFTVTSDRIVPGIEGGTYCRSNIRPACGPCNSREGSLLRWARFKALAG